MIIPEKISVLDFRLLKSQFHIGEDIVDANLQGNINVDVNLTHGVNVQEKVIPITLGIIITTKDAQQKEQDIRAEYLGQFAIKVQNLDDYLIKENLEKGETAEVTIDGSIIFNAVSIAYSTFRGIIYSQLLGTKLQGLMLPVIDPTQLIKGNKKNI